MASRVGKLQDQKIVLDRPNRGSDSAHEPFVSFKSSKSQLFFKSNQYTFSQFDTRTYSPSYGWSGDTQRSKRFSVKLLSKTRSRNHQMSAPRSHYSKEERENGEANLASGDFNIGAIAPHGLPPHSRQPVSQVAVIVVFQLRQNELDFRWNKIASEKRNRFKSSLFVRYGLGR